MLQVDGFQIETALDEPLLRSIATTTNGTYFQAADAQALAKVYDSIDLSWTLQANAHRGDGSVRDRPRRCCCFSAWGCR